MRRSFHYSLLALSVMAALSHSFAWAIDVPTDTDDTPEQFSSPAIPVSTKQNVAGPDDEISFDPIFLKTAGQDSIDLSRFAHGDAALPGIWPTDIWVNGDRISHEKVTFRELPDKRILPCLSMDILKRINLNYSRLPESFHEYLKQEKECIALTSALPQASISYDSSTQRLDISIPQAMMLNHARGYVSPELWDSGIPSLMVGYNASTYITHSNGQDSKSAYAGINAGLNIGNWYFRHDGSYNWMEKSGGKYESTSNYVQRDLPSIMGRVRIGETSTGGQLFDTVPFRGVEIINDDRMLPQSLRGYAPDIRGIARTNARVTVRQNSRVIYETTVSPGAFVVNDLYPTGYGGNLDVTVKEADGSLQTFQVPYASVPQLLRPGSHHYDFVVGKLNDRSIGFNPGLYQATWQQGLTNILTGYAGTQGSGADYYAVQGGVAISTPAGAISADVTQARVRLKSTSNAGNTGQSYQVSYNKFIPDTNSSLTLAAYRFSTSGYYDYLTAMRAINEEKHGRNAVSVWRPRNRFSITMNQGLPRNLGQVYVSGYTQNYWNNNQSDLQYQVGYSNYWGGASYSLSASRVRSGNGNMETNWLFNLSLPLGLTDGNNVPMLSASLNHNSDGRTSEQLGISGTAGADNQFSYGITGMRNNQGSGNNGSLSGGWRSPYSNLTATYGSGSGYQNASLGASGTVIAWPWGVVSTPYTGDTFAVVEAKGAYGAKVGNYSGIRIDPWGHAAVPYLNPYELNEITIDPKGLSYDVELDNTSEKVAPHAGAVSKVIFKTRQGTPLLILAHQTNGDAVPFAAEVYDSKGNNVGSVGQAGQIYARVNLEKDVLAVKWGDSGRQSCRIHYLLMPQAKKDVGNNLVRFDSVCQ